MSTRVIHDTDLAVAALYDSVTGIAFGPTFTGDAQHDAGEQALCFLAWCEPDPRILDTDTLEARQVQWAMTVDGADRCPLCSPPDAETAAADREDARIEKAENAADEARLAGAT